MQSFKAGRLLGAAFLSKGILSMDISRYMIPVEQLINCSEQCFAHLSEDGTQKETLKEHTEQSQKYWLLIAKNKCIDEIMERFEAEYFENLSQNCRDIFEEMTVNIVTMHDLGKVNPAFQKKKMDNIWYKDMTPDNNIGSKHSIVSSIFYLDYYLDCIKRMIDEEKITKAESEYIKDFAYMYSYIISRHHGGLTELEKYLDELSGKSNDSDNLGKRTYDWYTESGINAVLSYDRYSENVSKLRRTYKEMNKRLTSDRDRKSVILYAWIRLLYSMLVAADYYATSEYMTGWEQNTFGNINNIDEIISEYEKGSIPKSIREYEKSSYPIADEAFKCIDRNTDINGMKGINILRTEMFLDSENVLMNNTDKNIFYLEAPTGSGKSNMAMNLSFKLMKSSQDINKIFYIYPFNTLVEQNMNSLANVFGNNESVMSQIAVVNSITPYKDMSDDELDKNYQRILLDRQFMNYPTVLSTHVMLFNTMFGDRKEDAFGFHQLCNSVIVLDEIQSYDNRIWGKMITFLKGFAELLNIRIIIMSATLPNLELLTDNTAGAVKLITDRDKYFRHNMFAKRVEVDYSLLDEDITIEELAQCIVDNDENASKKVLIEFIKKKSAEDFYRLLQDMTDRQILLMTGDSSIQERKDMIDNISSMSDVVLVATQVIEAGVDIDMDIGYKDISRLDSEEQFMGRINRSGKKTGKVYFYNLDKAKNIYRNDARVDTDKTLENSDIREYLNTKDFFKYYENVILPVLLKSQEKITDDNIKHFFKEKVGRLNYPYVCEKMKLIEDGRKLISVYFARSIQVGDNVIDGADVWNEYKELIENPDLSYSERTVRIHDVRSKMNMFIYQFKDDIKSNIEWNEQIGDIYYIEDGQDYFDDNGVLKKDMIVTADELFI